MKSKAKPKASRSSKPASRSKQSSSAEASRVVKREAAKQKITLSLSEEQFEDLMRNFRPKTGGKFDPSRPFVIDFECGTGVKSRMPVASCAYWGDTCCA